MISQIRIFIWQMIKQEKNSHVLTFKDGFLDKYSSKNVKINVLKVASWCEHVVSFLKWSKTHFTSILHKLWNQMQNADRKAKTIVPVENVNDVWFSVRLQRNSWAWTRLQPWMALWMEPHLHPPKRCSPYCLHMGKGALLSHTGLLVQWEKSLTSC